MEGYTALLSGPPLEGSGSGMESGRMCLAPGCQGLE